MAECVVALAEDSNPVYYGLMRDGNDLMEGSTKLNRDLMAVRIPLVRFWKGRTALHMLAKPLSQIQKQFTEWSQRVTQFGFSPQFSFPQDTPGDLSYLHFSQLLRNRMDQVRSQVRVLEQNFLLKSNRLDDQRNFVIAITSALVSLAGLLASLWGVFLSSK